MSRKYEPLSKEAIAIFQGDLHQVLDRIGPCTKPQILRALRWWPTRLSLVLNSQPEWLVAVGMTRAESKFGKLVLYHCRGEHALGICVCGRKNFHPSLSGKQLCHKCISSANAKPVLTRIVPGVDVSQPTQARPSSEEKIRILEARVDRRLPLHLPGDRYERINPGWQKSQEEHDDE